MSTNLEHQPKKKLNLAVLAVIVNSTQEKLMRGVN